MKYKIDELYFDQGNVHVRGWAVPSEKANSTAILVRTAKKETIPSKILKINRPDVGLVCFGDRKADEFGFYMVVEMGNEPKMFVTFREISHVTGRPIDSLTIRLTKPAIWARTPLERGRVLTGIRYLRQNGIKPFFHKVIKTDLTNYQKWFEANKVSDTELQNQSLCRFDEEPKFSIIVPVYNTPLNFLKDMIQSVKNQSYANWELCIANGSGDNHELNRELERYARSDMRIKWVALKENKGISGNTNEAMALATGDFIALLDHDDMLAPDALYEYVKALNENPQIDAMYSDEDKVDQNGKKHFEPHFKSDLNMELLRTNNYICHFFAVRKSIVDQFGGFCSEYDGSQDYDFILKSVELSREVYHCPKILYYWRCHTNSTAENPESKMYAFEAGRKAVQAHFDRLGMDVTTEMGVHLGWYRNVFHLPYHPKVTILIPNKDHVEDLEKCLSSIYTKSTYDHYDVLIVENNSTDAETFAYYEKAKEKYQNLNVVTWDGPFNYSAINNFGAKYADGEYLLLLNNDIEVITPDFLEKMLGLCMQKQTAIVGARLYYEDDTVQHAGVIVGVGGVAAHAFAGTKRGEIHYMARNAVVQNLSAVTGACMLVKKSVYEEVNGLDEAFAVAFNDIDFCLRVRKAGYEVVYQPDAELYHYESKSRGYEDTPEKIERFSKEIARFNTVWEEFLDKGDPYYNPNFSLKHANYEIDSIS